MIDTPKHDAWRRRYDDAIVESVIRWALESWLSGDGLVVALDATWAQWCVDRIAARAVICGASVTVRGTTIVISTTSGEAIRAFRVRVCVDPGVVDTFRVGYWWRTPDATVAVPTETALRDRGALEVVVSTYGERDAIDATAYAAAALRKVTP